MGRYGKMHFDRAYIFPTKNQEVYFYDRKNANGDPMRWKSLFGMGRISTSNPEF